MSSVIGNNYKNKQWVEFAVVLNIAEFQFKLMK